MIDLKNKIIIGIGILLCIVTFFIGRYTVGTIDTKITVVTPEIKGSSPVVVNPIPIKNIIRDSIIYKDSIIYHAKFNKELTQEFIDSKSDLDKINQFIKAVESNEYVIPYNDDDVSINNYVTTEGKLKSFKQDYTIKERKTIVDIKIPAKIEFLVGAGVSNNIDLNKFNLNISAGIQRKNGDLIIGSYGLDKSIILTYMIKL